MGMLGVDAIFSAMSGSSMEVACAWRLHGKKSASRSQSIESRHLQEVHESGKKHATMKCLYPIEERSSWGF
jgi:hypothetical protein